MNVKDEIVKATKTLLKSRFGYEAEEKHIQVDQTRKEFEGDYTLVIFPFVKVLKMSPEQVGNTIGEYLQQNVEAVEGFNVLKGFLNLSLSASYWGNVLQSATEHPTSAEASLGVPSWFSAAVAKDLILVEYSSPNTNKPLHLGHLRNIFLGHSVALIREFDGYHVVKTQIINDRGVHICKSMLAWQKFGNGETPESSGLKGDKLVGKYYVKYDQHFREQVEQLVSEGMPEEQAKKEAPLAKEVQQMLVSWEQGNQEVVTLWKMMNGWVYRGFDRTYDRLGVAFDKLYYESGTYAKGKEIVLKALSDNIPGFYRKEDGSVWVDLEPEGLDHKLLLRGDGTTVYMTQDIGTAVQRYEDYPSLAQIIHTVGDEQDYHFKVLFKVLAKLGYEWASACRHLSYGMVDLPSGKMKSREGTVVDADDLMQEVVDAARLASEEKGKLEELSTEEQDWLFETLGIGALKFFLLRVDPKKRMLFNPEESVSLNGDTGPFVQYTHARCRAVLRKAGDFKPAKPAQLDVKERLLLRELSAFRSVTHHASGEMSPAVIATYCLEVAKLYNQFYHDLPILKAEGDERSFRLGLTWLTAETIKTGMGLLGIKVPERM